MMDVSYMELYKCQQLANETVQYWMNEYDKLPTSARDAEIALHEAYKEGCLSRIESWEFVEEHMELIVDQIGFIVEVEDNEMD